MSAEEWREVPEWEGLYWVSNMGRMRSVYTPDGKIRGAKVGKGYLMMMLCDGKRRRHVCIHRLVLEAFVGPAPPGYEGCHNNGRPSDNRLDNSTYIRRGVQMTWRRMYPDCMCHRSRTRVYPCLYHAMLNAKALRFLAKPGADHER